MFTNVLVGVDGKANGRDAIALASQLVDHDGRLTLANVHRDEPTMRAISHEVLEEERACAGVEAELLSIASSSPARGLHEQAEELAADLIVIGSCSRGALGRVMLGDDSRASLDGAPCTVAIAIHGFAERPQASLSSTPNEGGSS
jgi:nucleotide-binding universal stress UspA family protein